MDFDLVAQHARTIKDVYSQYVLLLNQKKEQMEKGMLDQRLEEKIIETKLYIIKLTNMIQRGIDEERENVYT
tara:strand:- start:28022 stop:28237 length:216 start_codon:yes stop_codon:yes gene_type:complete